MKLRLWFDWEYMMWIPFGSPPHPLASTVCNGINRRIRLKYAGAHQ